jgi:hypothetical protein
MATRRWIPVVLGVLFVLVLGMAALVGSCAYLVHQQVQVRESSSLAEYEREAATVMKRFEHVPPLIEDGPSGPRLSRKALARRQKGGDTPALSNLHVLVFSTKENKLVRLSLPFWLLRLAPDGKMDIDRDDVGLENVRLSIVDLEAAGAGPVFVRRGDDSRVLVWTD